MGELRGLKEKGEIGDIFLIGDIIISKNKRNIYFLKVLPQKR